MSPDNQTQRYPTTQNAQPAKPDVEIGQPTRVHHSYIWLGSLQACVFVLFLVVVFFSSSLDDLPFLISYLGRQTGTLIVLIPISIIFFIAVVFGISCLYKYFCYKNMWYVVGSGEFNFYSGILNKKQVHIPYQKIQSVDIKMPLLLRIFGLCNVSIDTAGGAANSATLIPYLTKNQAEALKNELYALKQFSATATTVSATVATAPTAVSSATINPEHYVQGQPQTTQQPLSHPGQVDPAREGNILDIGEEAWSEFGGVFAATGYGQQPASYEYGLSNKELFLAGMSGTSTFGSIVTIAICLILTSISMFTDTLSSSFISSMGFDSEDMWFLPFAVIGIAVFVIIATLFVWLISIVSTCLVYGGFHSRRRGEMIETEHGILQHQSTNISIDRVQSVIVKQTFIRRLMGYGQISLGRINAVDQAEASNSNTNIHNEGLIIHPFVKMDKVPEILNGIIPEFSDIPTEDVKVSKKALRRALIRRSIWQGGGFWLAVCVAILQITTTLLMPFMDAESQEVFSLFMYGYFFAYAAAVVIFVIDVISAFLWAKNSLYAVNRRFMKITNGGLSTTTVEIPRNKIQFGKAKTNPLQRLAHTATISAITAASSSDSLTQLIDVDAENADRWLSWLEPRRH